MRFANIFLGAITALAMSFTTSAQVSDGRLVSYVNPFVGTDFHGHTFPGAAYPFGMVQLSPDTRPDPGNWDGCSGYHYSDSLIYGFSHTHLSGTGCDDLCDVLLMPVRNYKSAFAGAEVVLDRDVYASPFSHLSERATPGSYAVTLEKPNVRASLSVSRRSGYHSYVYEGRGSMQLIVDLRHRDHLRSSGLALEDEYTLSGWRCSHSWADNQYVYFYIRFSRPVADFVNFGDEGALLSFGGPIHGRELHAWVGISSVSSENARLNLEADLKQLKDEFPRSRDYDVQALAGMHAAAAWEAYLANADKVLGSSPLHPGANLWTYYTALYHCAIHPSLYSDVNGEYRGMDGEVHKAVTREGRSFDRYTVFSLWDTFRGLHPLLTELEPELTVDFLRTFQSIFDECGKLPVWELHGWETNCMIGYNSAPVIADALARGICSHGLQHCEVERLLEALVASSNNPRFGLDCFRANGLVLADVEHESVSKTLEYAYDDWCVAQVALYLMKNGGSSLRDDLQAVYDSYMTSAQYWRNIFDPETGFMRPRLNGRWLTPFNPREVNNHFTEANSWQYSFFVPQDIAGLMEAMGGREAFEAKIDSLFAAPQQTTGRTQADITGLIGQYAHGNEPSHHIAYLYRYAGAPQKTKQRVSEILSTLYSDAPDGLCGNEDCGQMSAWYVLSARDRYTVCPANVDGSLTSIPQTIILNPVFVLPDGDVFKDSTTVTVEALSPDVVTYIKVGDGEYSPYSGPVTMDDSCVLSAYSETADGRRSFETVTSLHKVRRGMAIDIRSHYNPQYNAGGDAGLIDGFRGPLNWRTGGWQGYQDTDFEAVVDLLETKTLGSISSGYCQDARSWIWMPRYVEYFVSDDGVRFKKVAHIDNTVDPQDYEVQIRDFKADLASQGISARYIKVFAKNFGTIPSWHMGAGGEGFIFIDEIEVNTLQR